MCYLLVCAVFLFYKTYISKINFTQRHFSECSTLSTRNCFIRQKYPQMHFPQADCSQQLLIIYLVFGSVFGLKTPAHSPQSYCRLDCTLSVENLQVMVPFNFTASTFGRISGLAVDLHCRECFQMGSLCIICFAFAG